MENREQKFDILWVAAAFGLALFLRFIYLGSTALTDSEAGLALQALQLAKGSAVMVSGQPAYLALTTVLFYLFPASDFWARFWTAVFGSLLVLLPFAFTPWLGRRPALVLTFLLALEPGLIAISRTASAEMIAITCLVATFAFWLRRRSVLAGVSAGLAILAGAPFWLGALTFGLAFLLYKLLAKENVFDVAAFDEKKPFLTAIFSALATLCLIGTLFGTTPLLLSGLGSGVAEFFAGFAAKTRVSVVVMLLGLLLTQVLLVPLAIYGIISGPESHNKLAVLMILWAVLLFVVILVQPARQVVNWAWLVIPFAVLAVLGLESIFAWLDLDQWKLSLVQAGVTLALIVYSFLDLLGLVNNPAADSILLRNQVLSVVLPLAMVLVVTLLIGWGWSFSAARQGLVLGIGLLLAFVTLGNGWKAAGLGPRPEAELWRTGATPAGERLLLNSIEDISLYNTGEKTGIDVKLVALDDPALQWALHNFDDLTSDSALANTDTTSILLSSPGATLNVNDLYRGQSVKWKSQIDFSQMDGFDWVKWFATRLSPMNDEALLLWARTDLFKGSS